MAVATIISGLKSVENSVSRKGLGKGKGMTEVVAGVRGNEAMVGVGGEQPWPMGSQEWFQEGLTWDSGDWPGDA